MENKKLDYAAAGVDISAADQALDKIKLLAKKTFNDSVLAEIGSFGGFFKPDLKKYESPVLISSTDSVGTKLKLAFLMNKHDTVGEDIVNHCVNDILVHGATPLFFLDYIGIGQLNPDTVVEIVDGCARACKVSGVALIGGEMAELSDFYNPGEYDLVGTIVGMVDEQKVVNGSTIKEGDTVIGLASNGLHTNGYTLARKIAFDLCGLKATDQLPELGTSIGEALLKTHKSYLKSIHKLLSEYAVNGMAHITGGGLQGNFIRIIPEGMQAVIDKSSWPRLPIFDFLQAKGNIEEAAMFEAFNMGIGYIVVVDQKDAVAVIDNLKASGEEAYNIGQIVKGEKTVILQ